MVEGMALGRRTLPVGILLLVLVTVGLPVHASPLLQAGGVAEITSPKNGERLSGVVQIIGTATHPQFQRYELHFGPVPNNTDQWYGIGDPVPTQVENGLLAVWDTTYIPDGTYAIRLRVVRQDGNYTEKIVQVVIVNSEPTPTPTPAEPTATPLPTAVAATPTPVPIELPPTETPRPSPTPGGPPTLTPTPSASVLAAVNFRGWQDAFCNGALLTVLLFAVWGVLLFLREAIRFLLRRGREDQLLPPP